MILGVISSLLPFVFIFLTYQGIRSSAVKLEVHLSTSEVILSMTMFSFLFLLLQGGASLIGASFTSNAGSLRISLLTHFPLWPSFVLAKYGAFSFLGLLVIKTFIFERLAWVQGLFADQLVIRIFTSLDQQAFPSMLRSFFSYFSLR